MTLKHSSIKPDKKRILKEVGDGVSSQPQTNWRSIYVAAALSFVGSAQFSLYFSSLWPYLNIIDRSISETFFGYIIAIYSLGQIISSPLFGYWSNQAKTVRLPLYVGLLLMFIGNAFYICLEVIDLPKRYLLLIGRFITGMGSGNVSLLRTYASTASTSADRPKAIAFVTCGQAIAPAYLACAMNFFGAVALYFYFKEEYAGLKEEDDLPKIISKDSQGWTTPGNIESGAANKVPPYDMLAVLVCYITRFTQMFINTNLETLGSPYSMMMFAWTEKRQLRYLQ
uniref:Major facilitator superfamily (MFS) profile domain-containing protein n=1 Tax=Ditylenchus dipsaci TaxID=166011 RepID=A0A915E2M3_9BILA